MMVNQQAVMLISPTHRTITIVLKIKVNAETGKNQAEINSVRIIALSRQDNKLGTPIQLR